MKSISSLALIAFVAGSLLTGCTTTDTNCGRPKAASCGASSCTKASPSKMACPMPCCAKPVKKS